MANRKKILLRKTQNLLQTLVLISLMASLLGVIGYLIAGRTGALWSVVLGILLLFITPRVSPGLVLRMYYARPLAIHEAPGIYALVHELSKRAELERPPIIYYIPSSVMNAFSVGNRDQSAIALTDGLLRTLNRDELTGVLAHEMAHVVNGDLRIMNLADVISRFTSAFSTIGLILLILYIPFYILAGLTIPLPAVLILLAAPTASLVLQLALSRTREFEADLAAVSLTGDPRGLASALARIELHPRRLWDILLMPGRKVPDPSMLRSHPQTEKRIARLLELAGREEARLCLEGDCGLPENYTPVTRPPRWKRWGLWH